MKKKLITVDNISDFIDQSRSELHVDKTMILTAGARDMLRERGVKVIYGSCAVNPNGTNATSSRTSGGLRSVVERIISILRDELDVKDGRMIERVSRQVVDRLTNR